MNRLACFLIIEILSIISLNAQWIVSDAGMTYPGAIPSIVKFKGNLLATTYFEGAYSSSDGGYNWSKIKGFSEEIYLRELAAFEDRVFLSTDSGLYRSFDGITWHFFNNGLPLANGVGLSAKYGELLAAFNSGLYLSKDSAKSWTRLDALLAASPVNDITEKAYLKAMYKGKVYSKSRQVPNGDWIDITAGINQNATLVDFISIGDQVYALSDSSNVYLLNSIGTSWQKLNTIQIPYANCFIYDQGTFYMGSQGPIGVYTCTLNQMEWKPLDELQSAVPALLADDTVLLAGGYKGPGIFRRTIKLNVTGIDNVSIKEIKITQQNGTISIVNYSLLSAMVRIVSIYGRPGSELLLEAADNVQIFLPQGFYSFQFQTSDNVFNRKIFID